MRLLLATLPALAIGALFELFLGHRHDYTGHFLAGYGGTLGAFMVWLRQLSGPAFGKWSVRGVVPVCVVCILLGMITEATIFRIAKFDEIDLCNQSLGAVLAALVGLAYAGPTKLPPRAFDYGLIAAIAFLGAGGCFAVA
jgi:hypothetical protein